MGHYQPIGKTLSGPGFDGLRSAAESSVHSVRKSLGPRDTIPARILCPDCHGAGGPLFETHAGRPLHAPRCATCDGAGIVCPTCRGIHWVQLAPLRDQIVGSIAACPDCMDGVPGQRRPSADMEAHAIRSYLAAYGGQIGGPR